MEGGSDRLYKKLLSIDCECSVWNDTAKHIGLQDNPMGMVGSFYIL